MDICYETFPCQHNVTIYFRDQIEFEGESISQFTSTYMTETTAHHRLSMDGILMNINLKSF